MAHFAQLGSGNVVQRVVVVPDAQEHRGEAFLRNDLGLGGRWVQTSYNGSIRRCFAGIGMLYDSELDMFIAPQPYPSWTLDEGGDWQAPVGRPDDGEEYTWDEAIQSWQITVEG